MVDINLLEKRWLIYKLKTKIPYAITITIFILVILFFSIIEEFQKRNLIQEKKVFIKKEKIVPKKREIKEVEVKKVIYKRLLLEPSFNFLKRMQTDTVVYTKVKKISKTTVEEKPMVKKELNKELKKKDIISQEKSQKNVSIKKLASKSKVSVELEEVPKEKAISITPTNVKIKRREKFADIEDVVERFNNSNNPILSLFIARKYYEMGEYNKAYNYALITNKLDSNLEESWFIFSKALVKLNKKRVAVDVLQKYIEHTDSQEGSVLLEKIQKGELK